MKTTIYVFGPFALTKSLIKNLKDLSKGNYNVSLIETRGDAEKMIVSSDDKKLLVKIVNGDPVSGFLNEASMKEKISSSLIEQDVIAYEKGKTSFEEEARRISESLMKEKVNDYC